MYSKCVFLFVTFVGVTLGKKAPFITPCTRDDEACIISSSQKALPVFVEGVPELGIDPLDPIMVEHVHVNSDGLDLHISHLEMSGLAKTEFINVSRVVNGQKIIEFKVPVVCKADYNVSGTFVSLPIEGNGCLDLSIESLHVTATLTVSNIEKDGEKYFNIDKLQYEYEPNGKISMKLHNLYNGDESKAKPVMDIINATSKDLLKTIGKPIINKLVQKVFTGVKSLFSNVPANELEIV